MQFAQYKSLTRWIRLGLCTWLVGLAFVAVSSAQMLEPEPDRRGWGVNHLPEDSIDDWPFETKEGAKSKATNPEIEGHFVAPISAVPLDPEEETRGQIELATYDTDIKVASAAAVPPDHTVVLPPRDEIADPFLKLPSTFTAEVSAGADAVEVVANSDTVDFSSISQWFSGSESRLPRSGLSSSIKAMLLLATLSLAPAIVLMTTSYVRVVVVLSLLKQAFGSQQLPPTQVITALSLFLTMLVMAPVWNDVKTEAIDPYSASGSHMTWQAAWQAGIRPVRRFMQKQIQLAGNEQSIATFYQYLPQTSQQPPSGFDEVPFNVLLPAFMVSELKVAFLLGFQIFLPFLVLDLVVSSVTVSMGMLMLPPNMVSFPLKLILFVMVDGWNLVIGMLLQSFGPFG